MHILILIGPPGCGKGTLSAHLQTQGYHAVSTGEHLRFTAKHDPALAEQLAIGTLTDDHKITELLKQAFKGQTKVLLDGYPRTLPQVSLLAEAFPHAQIRALELQVSDELALKRVAQRTEQTGHSRPEDRPQDALAVRLTPVQPGTHAGAPGRTPTFACRTGPVRAQLEG